MAEEGNGGKRHVTNRELDEKLEKLEAKVLGKWEGRFLILAAFASIRVLPLSPSDVAQAAVQVLK